MRSTASPSFEFGVEAPAVMPMLMFPSGSHVPSVTVSSAPSGLCVMRPRTVSMQAASSM